MNILIPHSWLLEHLQTNARPEKIQEYLSLCGPSVERIKGKNGKAVYDIEITTNRVDMMSVRGIAREAAAILPEFGKPARLKPLTLSEVKSPKVLDLKIKNDPSLCHRILAVKLTNVKIGPSPSWLTRRLIEVDQRPLLNAIDITNYVMWEIGHPIHVFDYDRLLKKTIIVRLAKKGETLITLDEKKHQLQGGEVIFDDGTGKIIDLPGIMGTANTVVTKKTRNVLLWIESIDATRIRNASMNLAIRSQAAVLNEKGVDRELGMTAIRRAIDLMKKVTNASVSSRLIDIYETKPKFKNIPLKQELLDTYMGASIEPKKVTRILSSLGCKVKHKSGQYTITPPSWRSDDLRIPQDAIEEIARIYGYHRLPSRLMEGKLPLSNQEVPFYFQDRVKDQLTDWGLTEVYTYSLVSRKLAELSEYKESQHLRLSNPLSEDQVYLRLSIVPSHLEVISNNQNKKNVFLFELANVYTPKKGTRLPQELLQLVLCNTASFEKTKALVELMLTKLRIPHQFLPLEGSVKVVHPSRSAMITANESTIGVIGEVKPEILDELSLASPVTTVVLDAEKMLKLSQPHPAYQPLPHHPPIIEDLTFVLPEKTYVGELIDEITSTSRLIESVVLKETYERNATFTITYRHPDRSLSAKEIMPARKKIKAFLNKHFDAKLVGNL